MRQLLVPFFLILLLLHACQNGPENKGAANFFPVVSFIEGQVHHVDSLQPTIQKLTTVNNQTDTFPIETGAFDSLSKEFTTPDINDPALSKYYKENSFADQTIASVTLTYAATNKDLPLQRLDVIIHPDPVANDRVQSIYMERGTQVKDTLVLKKLYWRTDRNFQIITAKQAGAWSASSVVKVVWNGGY
ncbi:MAG: hypothetical protein INR73_15195 [Williamsia sp.]|nr:hypothetical protein [Williamsia sp.]